MTEDFLTLTGVILRAGQPFVRNGEMRLIPTKELTKKAADSFVGKPLSDGHPDEPNSGNHVTPENFSKNSKGSIKKTWVENGELWAEILIGDAELVEDIKNGKIGLSAGYSNIPVSSDTGKVFETEIQGNHVALTNAPRQAGTQLFSQRNNVEMVYNSIEIKNSEPPKTKGKTGMEEENQNQPENDPSQMDDKFEKLNQKIDKVVDALGQLIEMLTPQEEDAPDNVENEANIEDKGKNTEYEKSINSLEIAVGKIGEKLSDIEKRQNFMNREAIVNDLALKNVGIEQSSVPNMNEWFAQNYAKRSR